MENKYGIVGVAHVGLPTNDLQKTVEFYKSLGSLIASQNLEKSISADTAAILIPNTSV